MSDESRDRELPQRQRGATRAGAAPVAVPAGPQVLTDELRQRMQAAVQAERAHAAGQVDQQVDQHAAANGEQKQPRRTKRSIKAKPAAQPGKDAGGEPPVNGKPSVSSGGSAPSAPARLDVRHEPVAKAVPHVDDVFTDEIPPVRLQPDDQVILDLPRSTGVPPVSAPQPVQPPPVSAPRAPEPVKALKPPRPPKPVKAPKPPRPPKPVKAAKPPERPRAPAPLAQPEPAKGNKRSRRRLLTTGLIALTVLAVISVGVTSFMVVRSFSSRRASPPSAALQHQEAAARDEAAAWVAAHVRSDADVSCDPVMCSALRASGFPPGKLRTLGRSSPPPLKSAVVVETAAVREQFGTSLDSLYAPEVLAAVGSGDAAISIRVIARDGPAAYRQALVADMASRQASGAALLQAAGLITVSPLARKQLISGQVDSRLLIAFAALAAAQPIHIVEFGNIGSGGSADMPLRFADLSTADPSGHMNNTAYVQSLESHLSTAPGAHPDTMNTGVLPGDQSILRVEFLAPSPLGLLSP